MSTYAVIGGQWGDEGKAKFVDDLAGKLNADAVVRYHGGSNSGHTLRINGQQIVLHNLSVAVARQGIWSIGGPYVVYNPAITAEEISIADKYGAYVLLDPNAFLILPIHEQIDQGRERAAGDTAIGTTGQGIGPTYEDVTARRGVRLGDLQSADLVRAALEKRGFYAERSAVARHLGQQPKTLDEAVAWAMQYADALVPRLGDTRKFVHKMLQLNKTILVEGAQGMMLSLVSGTWPYCTSSICGPGAIVESFGIHEMEIYGVAKPYGTRVGGGPFPTEFNKERSEWLQEMAGEYGATTGRPRRCGRLDLVALRYACRMGNIKKLMFTKMDLVPFLGVLEICVAYEHDGRRIDPLTSLTADLLERVTPIYETLPAWEEDLSLCKDPNESPHRAKQFLGFVEEYLGIPVIAMGVGPNRGQTLWLD